MIILLFCSNRAMCDCGNLHTAFAHLQDVADLLIETLIDAKKPVEQWDWKGLLEQVK